MVDGAGVLVDDGAKLEAAALVWVGGPGDEARVIPAPKSDPAWLSAIAYWLDAGLPLL